MSRSVLFIVFSTPMALKTCLSYICDDGGQFQMEIRKTSSCRPRSVVAELGHFRVVVFAKDGKGIQRFLTHVLSYCFSHYTFC